MFTGLKIIELAGVMAGPAAGSFFAELGADVVKIENPRTGGDITRQWKLPSENPASPTSAYFASVNWRKLHLFLDLHDPECQQQVRDMIRHADVMICNWKKGDAEKFHLDHETVAAINPGIIYANINGFGDEEDRVAFDVVLQAETGWMFMNGTPTSPPVKLPVAIIDQFAAHQLKEGILTALIHKMRTGKGLRVTVSLYDAAIAALANQASNYITAGHVPQRIGSLHPNIAPYGEILTCCDGKQVVLAIGSNKQFKALCTILGDPALAEDPRYKTNNDRVANRNTLIGALQSRVQSLACNEFLTACKQQYVPVGAIRNLEQVFTDQSAQDLILSDEVGKRVKSAIFKVDRLV